VKLSAARRSDVTAIAMIMNEWIQDTPWMPKLHTILEDRKFIRRMIDRYDVRVLRRFAAVQGVLARDGALIHALYLRKRFRSRGYGVQLLDTAKEAVDRLELWTFQANVRARAFYAREGFREVELTDGSGNDEALPDVRLVWERGDD